jgi:hypothetical protein
MFKNDLFKVYDDALTDCAVVQKIIEDAKDEKSSAFAVFIEKIQKANKNPNMIKDAKQEFLDKMITINTKQSGGDSMKKIQDLKNSFAKQAAVMGSTKVSQATPVSGNTLTGVLSEIDEKTKSESDEIKNGIESLKTQSMGGGSQLGISKQKRGGKSKKRRKRTYKRR